MVFTLKRFKLPHSASESADQCSVRKLFKKKIANVSAIRKFLKKIALVPKVIREV